MTAKEKAKELVDRFEVSSNQNAFRHQKQCALICVDEKIKTLKHIGEGVFLRVGDWYKKELNKLEEIKQEI